MLQVYVTPPVKCCIRNAKHDPNERNVQYIAYINGLPRRIRRCVTRGTPRLNFGIWRAHCSSRTKSPHRHVNVTATQPYIVCAQCVQCAGHIWLPLCLPVWQIITGRVERAEHQLQLRLLQQPAGIFDSFHSRVPHEPPPRRGSKRRCGLPAVEPLRRRALPACCTGGASERKAAATAREPTACHPPLAAVARAAAVAVARELTLCHCQFHCLGGGPALPSPRQPAAAKIYKPWLASTLAWPLRFLGPPSRAASASLPLASGCIGPGSLNPRRILLSPSSARAASTRACISPLGSLGLSRTALSLGLLSASGLASARCRLSSGRIHRLFPPDVRAASASAASQPAGYCCVVAASGTEQRRRMSSAWHRRSRLPPHRTPHYWSAPRSNRGTPTGGAAAAGGGAATTEAGCGCGFTTMGPRGRALRRGGKPAAPSLTCLPANSCRSASCCRRPRHLLTESRSAWSCAPVSGPHAGGSLSANAPAGPPVGDPSAHSTVHPPDANKSPAGHKATAPEADNPDAAATAEMAKRTSISRSVKRD